MRRALSVLLCLCLFLCVGWLLFVYTFQKQKVWTSSTVKILVGGGHGSGVQILPGYILTAAHVAKGSVLTVRTQGGDTAEARLLWKNDAYDVALLRVDGLPSLGVSPLQCEAAPVGMQVKAIGNPGPYDFAHSWGRISAPAKERFFWKSAALVDIHSGPGASGGPILNMRGAVVGIVVGLHEAYPGFLIVVPSSVVCDFLARPRAI